MCGIFSCWPDLFAASSMLGERTSSPHSTCSVTTTSQPLQQTSSDGWQNEWRPGTWNSSVWGVFSNPSLWNQLGDICYNPCFNSSQVLRQTNSLQSWVASQDSELSHPNRLWKKAIYSNRYIYSLIIICLILNIFHLIFKWLPYASLIPSAQIVVIWKERKAIWHNFKQELKDALSIFKEEQAARKETETSTGHESSRWSRIRPLFTIRFLKASLRVLADAWILFGLVFSVTISPFTIIAFVVWIEWWINHDGPSQEHPQQVGQWSYLVSIALLLVSAAILSLKHRLATTSELDTEIERTRTHLEQLQQSRDARSESEIIALAASADAEV